MQLSDFDKSRVRYHLGYFTVSVPAGDYARLEEAMNTIPDSFFYDKITIQIGRCDTAEKKTEVATSPSTRLESIAGDVDRTIRSSNAKEAWPITKWAVCISIFLYVWISIRYAAKLFVANATSHVGHFVANRYTVVVSYVWPGRNTVVGKLGLLGESG